MGRGGGGGRGSPEKKVARSPRLFLRCQRSGTTLWWVTPATPGPPRSRRLGQRPPGETGSSSVSAITAEQVLPDRFPDRSRLRLLQEGTASLLEVRGEEGP